MIPPAKRYYRVRHIAVAPPPLESEYNLRGFLLIVGAVADEAGSPECPDGVPVIGVAISFDLINTAVLPVAN
jgi:hypothetical protein